MTSIGKNEEKANTIQPLFLCFSHLHFGVQMFPKFYRPTPYIYEDEKNTRKGFNCVCFFFVFSYWSHWSEAVRLQLLKWCSVLNAADKNTERERERRKTQSNYTGSFHKPEVVLSPCTSKESSLKSNIWLQMLTVKTSKRLQTTQAQLQEISYAP